MVEKGAGETGAEKKEVKVLSKRRDDRCKKLKRGRTENMSLIIMVNFTISIII